MASPQNIPKLALSIEEVATCLGIGKTKAYELVNSGEIPSIALGQKRIVPMDALRKFLELQDLRSTDERLRSKG